MTQVCRFALLIALIVGGLYAAEPSVDDYVTMFNPDLYAGAKDVPMVSAFTGPATNMAHEANWLFWFSFWCFVPFLIAPLVLLIYVMVKYRERKGDTRKPATFMHNGPLEVTWTAIPILALIIVAIPIYPVLIKMELAPKEIDGALQVTVRGKQFAWEYDYKDSGVNIGGDLISGQQEPIVIIKDRAVALSITSNDVNHAWWIPAFGVKKDAVKGRFNSCWFIPERTGFFKGQCAELCGANHGAMIIGAVVVEAADYTVWTDLQKRRAAAQKVWDVVGAWEPGTPDDAVRLAVTDYRAKATGSGGDFALRYWLAHNARSLTRLPMSGVTGEAAVKQALDQRKKQWDDRIQTVVGLLTTAVTDTPAPAPVVAQSTLGQE